VAVATKNKILLFFGTIFLTVAGVASILVYMVTSEIEVNIAHNPNSIETQEANRKLKLFNEALAGKKPGFIRLNQTEINGFLQSRYGKPDKNKANAPVQLVKAGLLLRQTDLTFITWHKVSVFGMEFPVVWQRVVSPLRNKDGWRLSLDEMHLGKLSVPGDYWADVSHYFGSTDAAFEERKVWLASVPTVMISQNEISRTPELRLYTYIPVVRADGDPLAAPENLNTSSTGSTNTLTANLAQ
jgi:hypothetical protein